MIKKIAISFSIFVVTLAVALIVAPKFYDVNAKLKPLIIQAIESNLDVKAELGNLDLDLLFGVNIGISSLKLTEIQSKNVLFQMENASLRIPYLSLLTGKISVTLISDKPRVSLLKLKDGSLNISKIMKATAAPTETQAKATGGGTQLAPLGAIAFSTKITEAEILFKDLQTGFDYKIDKFNLGLDNVGLNRDFSFTVSTDLGVDNKKDLFLKGGATIDGQAKVITSGAQFENILLKSEVDLTSLEVKAFNLLNKTKDIPFKIALDLEASAQKALLKNIETKMGQFKVQIQGSIQNFTAPLLDLKITSNDLDLDEWKKAILPLKQMDMQGLASLDLTVKGSPSQTNLGGTLQFKKGSLKIAALNDRITDLQATINLSGNRATIKGAGLKIGASDLNLSGTIENFSSPKIEMKLTSSLLNLDKMLPAAPVSEKKAYNPMMPTIIPRAYAQESDKALSELLAQIRNNPLLAKIDLSLNAQIQKAVIQNAELTDLKADVFLKNLVFTMKNATLKAFQGAGKTFFQIDLSQAAPSFQFTTDLNNIDINSAILSQSKELDKFLTGKANANLIINGVGLESQQIRKNLKGTGGFFVKEGAWSGAKPLKSLGEKVSKIPKAGEYLSKVNITDRFKELKADFLIQNGALNIQKALMDMEDAKTAIEANGQVDFDLNLKLAGGILAPIKDVPKDLKNRDGRARIPFEMRGKAKAPTVEWEKTIGPIAKAYAKDEGKKLLKQGAEKLIKDENVKKLFDKIKF